MQDDPSKGPVAIGAVGGSGTRVVAEFLKLSGFYMGNDLNEANDNLWFTMFFKRRDILLSGDSEFSFLCDLFVHAMTGNLSTLSDRAVNDTIRRLTNQGGSIYPATWWKQRTSSLLSARPSGRWGWKEPNTHVIVDRLLNRLPNLRYIHVVRNGLDMAYNRNQKQLAFWGPIFLGRDVLRGPRDSLAYWCAAHRRMKNIADAYPHRILFVDFDQLCQNPQRTCRAVAAFCGVQLPDNEIDAFASTVIIPESSGIYRRHDRAELDPSDVDYAAEAGYQW